MISAGLWYHNSKSLTRILRHRCERLGLKPSLNGWFELPKLLNLEPLRKFLRVAVLETIRLGSCHFMLAGDLIKVQPDGTTAGHRRIDATIPESSLPLTDFESLSKGGDSMSMGTDDNMDPSAALVQTPFTPSLNGNSSRADGILELTS
jgi:hypothetical protein